MGYGVFYGHLAAQAARLGGQEHLPELLHEARRIGVDRLTVDGARADEAYARAKETGMGINIVYYVNRMIHGEGLAETLRVAERAAFQGAAVLMIVPGFYEGGLTDREALKNAAPLLRETVRVGNSLGLDVTVENFGGKRTPYSTVGQIEALLASVEGLGYVFDSGNALYHRVDPLALWEATKERCVAVHAKDLAETGDETYRVETPSGDTLYPCAFGDGLLPARTLCDRIRAHGIAPERITFEHDAGGAPDTLSYLRRSVSFFEEDSKWKISN